MFRDGEYVRSHVGMENMLDVMSRDGQYGRSHVQGWRIWHKSCLGMENMSENVYIDEHILT